MFASFPKLFDKNFVVGFLLPVVLGLIAVAWLCPEIAVLKPLRSVSASEKALGDFTYIALLTYVLAILLVTTNTLQYRLLEGYLPPIAWRGAQKHSAKRQALVDEYGVLMDRWRVEKAAFPATDRARADALKLRLTVEYPPTRLAAMPTAFGNIIRAFESYPLDVYGVDATPMWIRLASVIPKEFGEGLDDARAQVNVFLNLVFIMPVIFVIATLRTITDTPWRAFLTAAQNGQLAGWRLLPAPMIGVAALLLVILGYRMALASAKAWGVVVKSAFDCFLPQLVMQLGYAPPASEEERRAFWGQINSRIVYWQSVDPAHCKLAGAPVAPPKGWSRSLLDRLGGQGNRVKEGLRRG